MSSGPQRALLAVCSTFLLIDGSSPRALTLVALSLIWATRLSWHLGLRNLGHDEDPRYADMRSSRAPHGDFRRWSLINIFWLQGAIAWFISIPLQLGQFGDDEPLGAVAIVGIAIFLTGFAFETIGDAQLKAFKADPDNKGRLMTKGLWAWTRHPNYFGDACVWFGLALIALEAPMGWFSLASPVAMAHFLINVSGKAMTERRMKERYPEWPLYAETTSGFFPLPPKGKNPPTD